MVIFQNSCHRSTAHGAPCHPPGDFDTPKTFSKCFHKLYGSYSTNNFLVSLSFNDRNRKIGQVVHFAPSFMNCAQFASCMQLAAKFGVQLGSLKLHDAVHRSPARWPCSAWSQAWPGSKESRTLCDIATMLR